MLNRPLQSRTFNKAEDNDFWASGVMLVTGTVASAAFVLACAFNLAYPDTGEDLRASVTVGPVQTVAIGDAVKSRAPAALAPALNIAGGVAAGCQRSVLSTHL